jgi:leader peptidase (prepilin peptidase)/N-methyltransferase
VCIYRLPKGYSIVKPGSFCPYCTRPVKWYDNVPVLSYIILGGRCRWCGHRIPFRYVLVELVIPVTGVLIYMKYSFGAEFLFYWFFTMLLAGASFIDLENRLIPDVITIPGTVLGIIAALVSDRTALLDLSIGVTGSIAGVFSGILLMLAMAIAGQAMFKKEALGGGDVKLMAMIGAFLGWEKVILTFFMAPLVGSVAGLYHKYKSGENMMPYGPYLSIAAFINIFAGSIILSFMFNRNY